MGRVHGGGEDGREDGDCHIAVNLRASRATGKVGFEGLVKELTPSLSGGYPPR